MYKDPPTMPPSPDSYVKHHIFYLSLNYRHHSDEGLISALTQLDIIPQHYCIQRIIGKDVEASTDKPLFRVIAWIAPSAWFGSAEQLNPDGKLVYLWQGIPFQSSVSSDWTQFLSFVLPDPLPLTRPLAPPLTVKRLEGVTDAVAVYSAIHNSITVYRPKQQQPQQPEPITSPYPDIVAALCVHLSWPHYFYCPAVTCARIDAWVAKLEDHLLATYRALSDLGGFNLQDFLNLIVIQVLDHPVCDSLTVQFHESAHYRHGMKTECIKTLSDMTKLLLLFSHGKELFINLLTTGFSLKPGHVEALCRDFSDWISVEIICVTSM